MLNKSAVAAAVVTVAAISSFATPASAQADPALGALIEGGIGAAIGHSNNGDAVHESAERSAPSPEPASRRTPMAASLR